MYKLNEPRNRRILVIDDNEAIQDDFRKILAGDVNGGAVDESRAAFFGEAAPVADDLAFEVDSALQGQEGLERVRQSLRDGRPNAVAFVDVRMPPGWDGIETIGHLWREDPDLLVVICTAYNDYNWSEMTQQLGSVDRWLVLKKPFDNVEVRQLAASLTEKWDLARKADLKMEELQRMVEDRTAELQSEITERKKCERKLLEAKDALQYQATHDATTGLWNRRTIYDILEKEVARCHREGTPLGLAFADIDHFKQVNDEYGHQAGDVVLRRVAERLNDSIRRYDEVGRYGGEEFLIVLPGCSLAKAFDVSERARQRIEQAPVRVGSLRVPVTISIGVTVFENDDLTNLERLIHRADSAMYQAKRAGRNRVLQSTELDQALPCNS